MNDNSNQRRDVECEQVRTALDKYRDSHPHATIDVRRQNPVSIRIRIIDPDFQGTDRVDREPDVWARLQPLPEEIFANITMLLLLTPQEARSSLANQEFDDPIPSRL